jgi:hypothetical protein
MGYEDVECIHLTEDKALTMKAARTSEKSVDIQLRTRQYIPEDSELHVTFLPAESRLSVYKDSLAAY